MFNRVLILYIAAIKSVFDSVVAGAFQIIFRAKMHANDVFSFFKNHFWHQHIKTIENIQIILNFNKKKFQIFWKRSRSCVPKKALNVKDKWVLFLLVRKCFLKFLNLNLNLIFLCSYQNNLSTRKYIILIYF